MQQRVISLGAICEVAYQVKLHTDKLDADYFDWLITPYDALIGAIKNDFEGFFKLEDLKIYDDQKSVINTKTHVYYFHDFPLSDERTVLPDFPLYYEQAKSKYDHLKGKFLALESFPGRAIFIRRDLSPDSAIFLYKTLEERFPKLDFHLVSANSADHNWPQCSDKKIFCIEVPKTGPDGLEHAEPWCQELKRIGLTDTGYKKTYPEIVKAGRHHVFE